jgi:hypothetical protein
MAEEIEKTPDESGTGFYSSDYGLGEFASFEASDKPFVELNTDEKNALMGLVTMVSRTDTAARRYEVELAWEANLFLFGHQHLLPRRGGGWALPGENTRWGVNAASDQSQLYSTNTYGRDHDIIVGALAREVPEVQFFPVDPDSDPDITVSSIADDFAQIFAKNNDLRSKMVEAAHYMFTDDRVVFHTFFELNGEKYGWKDDDEEEPEVPETETPEDDEDVSETEIMSVEDAQELPGEEKKEAPEKKKRVPNGREVVCVYGKLASKVPIVTNHLCEMHAVQLYNEVDCNIAKATFPWIESTIKPGNCGIGEIELDYIARINCMLALSGAYTSGDSLIRLCTIQRTWLRPSMFFDTSINSTIRESFLEKFNCGVLVVCVGSEFAFAREESMDDHIVIAHPFPGNGQNRRALGSSLIGPQKRLNNWVDLLDDFFRSTVPKKWMDNDAFNVEALRSQTNKPGDMAPFQRQPGVPVAELIYIEPTPQPQQALPDFVMKFFTDIPQSLSGAVPSLWGGAINGQVGSEGYEMMRNQALERLGTPWSALKSAFAEVYRQAVMCAGLNRDGKISQYVPGKGILTLDADDLKGSVFCYAEDSSNFPESAEDRSERYMQIATEAAANPLFGAIMAMPCNIREMALNSKVSRISLPGEDAIEKTLGNIQKLLLADPTSGKFGPVPNPQIEQLNQNLMKIKTGIQTDVQNNVPIPPDQLQMAQKFEQMVQQKIQSLPPLVSTVQSRQDDSENHSMIVATLDEWLNSVMGRKYDNGNPDQKAAFANVLLYRTEQKAIVVKLQSQAAPQMKETVNITIPMDKMAPPVQAELLSKVGLTTSQAQIEQSKNLDTQHKVTEKLVPEVAKEQAIGAREDKEPEPEPAAQPAVAAQ